MRVLVDTSAWIEFYHPKGDPGVRRHLTRALQRDDVAIVAPIIAELLAGAGTGEESRTLQDDLRGLGLLPLGWDEAVTAGGLAESLSRTGRRTPLVDLLIAAAARRHGCEVWHAGDDHYGVIASVGGPPERNLRGAAKP